jgi:hypothetical protein
MEFGVDYDDIGSFTLPPDAGTVRGLKSYGGYVFVIAEAALLIFDVNDLDVPLRRVTPASERLQDLSVNAPRRGSPGNAARDDIQLLFTTNRGVYSLSLLGLERGWPPTLLYSATGTRSVYHGAVSCGGNVHWLLYDAASATSELHSLERGRVETYAGRVHPLIKFDEERLVIATAEGLSLYDVGRHLVASVTLAHEGGAELVSMSCQPAFDEKSGVVYFAGDQSLWSAAIDNGRLIAQRLQMRPLGDERLAAAEDNVFVARSSGFYILDTFGSVKWQADPIFISEDTSDGFPPQVEGKYCSFSGLKGRGSVMRVYSVSNPNKYTQGIAAEVVPACAPLLSAGNLIFAVNDAETKGRKLRAYRLGDAK